MTKTNKFGFVFQIIFSSLIVICGLYSMHISESIYYENDSTRWTVYESYGGDAYTGIQNAAADISVNVSNLTNNIGNNFRTLHHLLFRIIGMILIVVGGYLFGTTFRNYKGKESPALQSAVTTLPQPPESNVISQQPAFNAEAATESNIDKLMKCKELLDKGLITQEEFELKKKQLLQL